MIQLSTRDNSVDLIMGEVVTYHINKNTCFEDSEIDFSQLKPIARLAGDSYSRLGDAFTIECPES